jgi:hypothetical protein
LQTDATPIPDFQLGPGGEATPDPNPGEAAHTIEYVVGDPPGLPGDAKGIELDGDAIRYQKGLGMFGTMRCEIVLDSEVTRLTVNSTYHRLGRKSISTVPSVGRLLEDIVSIQLLRKGYALLYCGGVSYDGDVTLLVGPTNTGKTTTVLHLVENEGAAYIAEDIAITDGRNLYCCPYVMSPVDTELADAESNAISRWMTENIPLLDTRNVQSIRSVHDVFQPEQMAMAGRIGQVCFLSRNELQEEREATSLAMLVNRGEFTYSTNQILLTAEYLGYDVGVEAAMEAERQVLTEATAGNRVHHFSGNRTELYDDVRDVVIGEERAGMTVA